VSDLGAVCPFARDRTAAERTEGALKPGEDEAAECAGHAKRQPSREMSSVPSERVHHQPQKKPRGKEAGLGKVGGNEAVAFTAREAYGCRAAASIAARVGRQLGQMIGGPCRSPLQVV
jgi:hypothetical protein